MSAQYPPNPDNVPRLVTVPDDSVGDPPNASVFNTVMEPALDLAANARAIAIGSAVGNSYPAKIPVTNAISGVYCWDPSGLRWLAACQISGGIAALLSTHDGGVNWATVAALSNHEPIGIAVDPSNGTAVIVMGSASSGTVDFVTLAGVHTSTAGLFGYSPTGTGCATFDLFWLALTDDNVNMFSWIQTGGNFAGHWVTRQLGGASSTDRTATLPAALQAGATTIAQILVADTAGDGRRVAIAGDVMIVAFCGTTPAVDSSFVMKVVSNGALPPTITDISASVPSLGPAAVVTGLAWDDQNKLWGIAISTVASTVIFSSPDFVTWTPVHAFTKYPASSMGGLAVVGGVWVVWLGAPTGLPASEANRVFYSYNVTKAIPGSTWQSGGVSIAPAPSTLGNPATMLISNGSQTLVGLGTGAILAQISHSGGVTMSNSGVY